MCLGSFSDSLKTYQYLTKYFYFILILVKQKTIKFKLTLFCNRYMLTPLSSERACNY